MTSKFGWLAALVAVSAAASAQRAPTASFTVSGNAGSWDLEFTLRNNFLPGEGDFYFFGVRLESGRSIGGAPTNWNSGMWKEWTNHQYGGSGMIYNNNWINLYSRVDDIVPSASKSTFIVHSADVAVPEFIPFFAYAAEGLYGGNDNFSNQWNPGFEGLATNMGATGKGVLPEPASIAVLGLGAFGLIRRRKHRQ